MLKNVPLMCRAALAKTNIREPRIPVISNVDAHPHSDPDTIKDILARQVATPLLLVCTPCCHSLLSCTTRELITLQPTL